MTERFTGKVSGRNMVSNGIYGMIGKCGRYFVGEAIDKLAEYETAEEDGRLVVLPCKVGDTFWTFYDDMSDVVDFTVEKIQIEFDKNGKPYFLIDGMDFEEDCLGRTLFFDREEAEKALKEMEGK